MSSAIEGQLVFTIRLVQSKAPSADPWGQSRLATREKVGKIGFGPSEINIRSQGFCKLAFTSKFTLAVGTTSFGKF
jgi:hypothetical protein